MASRLTLRRLIRSVKTIKSRIVTKHSDIYKFRPGRGPLFAVLTRFKDSRTPARSPTSLWPRLHKGEGAFCRRYAATPTHNDLLYLCI